MQLVKNGRQQVVVKWKGLRDLWVLWDRNDGKSWKILFGYCHIYIISINMKVKWFQCDLDLKFHETTIFREIIDQMSRIWSLILKACVCHPLHLWAVYLRPFLRTAEDRNSHKLKVVNQSWCWNEKIQRSVKAERQGHGNILRKKWGGVKKRLRIIKAQILKHPR